MTLCVQCTRYLTEDKQREFASVFPSFMWVMLADEALLRKDGRHLRSKVPQPTTMETLAASLCRSHRRPTKSYLP